MVARVGSGHARASTGGLRPRAWFAALVLGVAIRVVRGRKPKSVSAPSNAVLVIGAVDLAAV